MEKNELSVNAMGGTELMLARLHASIEPDLLNQFQIIPSRVRELDDSRFRIFWAHDLAGDPEATKAVGEGRWDRFHLLVFVSNFQMQQYIQAYQIPWSKCIVIQNAIEPIKTDVFADRLARPYKDRDQINFIYHTTPHRGLNILLPVFEKLHETYPNIHLDVYSSWAIYGWHQRDEEFKPLFDKCDQHPAITRHPTATNDQIRQALLNADIFAYPSIWPETSCLALIEAMSAGLFCVHSNYGGLYETAGSWTQMYQYQEVAEQHAGSLYSTLDQLLQRLDDPNIQSLPQTAKSHADICHNWNFRSVQWKQTLESVVRANPPKQITGPQFRYSR